MSQPFTLAVQVFLVSFVLLFCGLVAEVWNNAVRFSFLNKKTLAQIEREKPYFPSIHVILGIVLVAIVLLFIAMVTTKEIFNVFTGDEWLHLAIFFVNACAFGILAEIKWNGARDYALAFTIGSGLAFAYLIVRETIFVGEYKTFFPLFGLLGVCGFIAWRAFFLSWSTKVQTLTVIAFVVFLVVFLR